MPKCRLTIGRQTCFRISPAPYIKAPRPVESSTTGSQSEREDSVPTSIHQHDQQILTMPFPGIRTQVQQVQLCEVSRVITNVGDRGK